MKTKVIILGLILFSISMNAQKKGDNEVHIGISDATYLIFNDTFLDIATGLAVSPFGGKEPKFDSTKQVGMFEVGYKYNLSERVRVGADVNYLKIDDTYIDKKNNDKSYRKVTYLMVMPNIDYAYIKTSKIRFYGSASAGYINYSAKYSKEKSLNGDSGAFAFQVNPLALNWSFAKNFGVFCEFGFGFKGVATGGLNYIF